MGPGGMVIEISRVNVFVDGGYGVIIDRGHDPFWRKHAIVRKFDNIVFQNDRFYRGKQLYKPQEGYTSTFYVDSEIRLADDDMSFTSFEFAFSKSTTWYKAEPNPDGPGYRIIRSN
jgi:hypothetical protein